MATEQLRDPDFEWLDMLQPTGLVAGRNLLRELGLVPERQTKVQSAEAEAFIEADTDKPALKDPWGFVAAVLGWEARHVAGSPEGPPLPDTLMVRLPEYDTTLSPTWAVKELGGNGGQPWQLLVRIETGIDPDQRGALAGWKARTAHQRFERLLRETGVFAGLMIADKELRLIYAPRGETSGWLSFPIRALATVAGRPMLAGLKLLLDSVRLFTDADERRLPALLKKSREAQAAVSTALAEQVLGALHEMLRGLDTADGPRIRDLATAHPGHLYEGLLTVLMRLVFILYAEDRDLLPSRTDERARELYESGYSLRGLFGRLTEDAVLNPDTMDERRGAWGRLLALFRLIHKGHPTHFVQARGGKLFDPEAFPFLEGSDGAADPPRVLPVSDGTILRILEGLMTLKGRNGRERLSYRSLDVEQIGSVYEIVMGFKVVLALGRSLAIRAAKNNRTPVFVDLERLLTQKGKDRIKYLKEEADRGQLSPTVTKKVEAAKALSDLAAALDPIVDERASQHKHETTPGTPILQPTDERRRTGSHYTPRSLTEPIVRYALEPAFERLGPDATPEQILDLKVCDPAMGSGAFLVEACRAIAAKLVKAWERWPQKKPALPADEDEDLHARRLVAQRCLYGVDKNPLATDLAKLSLWLATLARDHEFTFLDHALKSGDSLVGLSKAQIAAVHWAPSKPGLPLFRSLIAKRVAEAMKGRAEIQAAPDDTRRSVQEARHKSLEARLKDIRLMGNAVIAAFFAEDKPRAREKKRAEVESLFTADINPAWVKLEEVATHLQQGEHPLPPFHWEVEFPEVFARDNGGFDAIVGNPPFRMISDVTRSYGKRYTSFVSHVCAPLAGKYDISAAFFVRAYWFIRNSGCVGLLATNSIRQGASRKNGLKPLLDHGGTIYSVSKEQTWPGEDASVRIVFVHIIKGDRTAVLRGKPVSSISQFLSAGPVIDEPATLSAFRARIAIGTKLRGDQFFVENDEGLAEEFIAQAVGGEDLMNEPPGCGGRICLNLNALKTEPTQDLFHPVWAQLQSLKAKRKTLGGRLAREWWRYEHHPKEAYDYILRTGGSLVKAETSPQFGWEYAQPSCLYLQTVYIVSFSNENGFACLQSRPHEVWVRFFSSSMKEDLRYNPSDCFDTFPFPPGFETSPILEAAGQACHDHRAELMTARNEGMTKAYNRFHDRNAQSDDIRRLRELHAEMDRAVLHVYGWHDLAARAEQVFLDETNEDDHTYEGRLFWPSDFRDEVLARLLVLNAERHAEEVRLGIAPGMKGRAEEDQEDNTDE